MQGVLSPGGGWPPGRRPDAGKRTIAAPAMAASMRRSMPQLLPQRQLAGDIGEPGADSHPVAAGIEPEDLDAPRGGAEEVEDAADGGALAGPIGPQEADHLAGADLEADAAHGPDGPVVLDQAIDSEDGAGRYGSRG